MSIILNKQINKIKTRMKLLYVLNILDLILTIFLINITKLCSEANVIMKNIITSPFKILVIKILLPLALLYILLYLAKISDKIEIKIINLSVWLGLIMYGCVSFNHVFLLINLLSNKT